MFQRNWRCWGGTFARVCSLRAFLTKQQLVFGGLLLVLLTVAASCQQSPSMVQTWPSPTARPGFFTPEPPIPFHPNLVPTGTLPQFVLVTFMASTTYEQALALFKSVGQPPYPWACGISAQEGANSRYTDAQLSPAPLSTRPPSPEVDTPEVFARTHQFLISYPTQQQLDQFASSPLVASMYAVRLSTSSC
jgi:hypothetical protein